MSEETAADSTVETIADDGLPKRRAARAEKAEKPAATTKYLVINGAISPNGGGRSALVHPGSVVELTTEQAKHYNAMGYLKPYIED